MANRGTEKDPVPRATEWWNRHLWEITPVRDVLIALGVIAFFALGARLSIVTVPFLLALLLAYLLDPAIRRLEKVKFLSRQSAVALVAVCATIGIGGATLFGTGFAAIQSARLAATVTERGSKVLASVEEPNNLELRTAVGSGGWLAIRDFIVEVRAPLPGNGTEPNDLLRYLGVDRADITAAVDRAVGWFRENSGKVAKTALATGANAVESAVSLVGSVGRFVFEAFLTLFFFFFLATEWNLFAAFVRSSLPERNRDGALDLAGKMDHAISGFVRGRLTIAACLAVFYTIGFAFMGVPAALLLGGLIAILSLMPYAVVVGIPVVIVLLWLETQTGFRGEWWFVLGAPIVWYQIGQTLDDYVLTPAIQGKATDLATPEIVFASIAAGSLFGVFGLLVAIPLAACLKIVLKEVVWPRYRAYCEREVGKPNLVK
jgi:predicted PurR-regulated permease PerM